MLATEMKELSDRFNGWCIGKPYPSVEDWFKFRSDLRAMFVKVAMHELGVDLSVVDVAVEAAKPDSKVVFLHPRRRRPVPITGGDAS